MNDNKAENGTHVFGYCINNVSDDLLIQAVLGWAVSVMKS